jgi:FAD/FMN-containing dehydrogenase
VAAVQVLNKTSTHCVRPCCGDHSTQVHNEAEIRRILPIAKKHGVPITFRAAGTSLSGQAITDSVLLKLSHTGKNFRNFTIHVSGRCGR